ncbi:cation transporter [Chelonobacter oris]|uniref:Cation transporter n=1 Tax=Chelonobacter oris TaxID=505317 RepID=A0A0A3ANG3_9PAST|nr:SLC13 family permease [Chelonobacter oris]KGQ70886.1 cation transporter [Chelonobacter oris]MDH2999362.1 cation transporter [Chelonobacter oris]
MSPSTITLLFLLFAVIMFIWEKIPLALTAMIVCIGLILTGVLDVKTAFLGFIDSNVILIVAMFVIGGALFETGMANKIGGLVTRFAKTERQLTVAVMLITGLMSGLLSNTGTAAILIPVVIGIATKANFSRSRLLMPLVFAAAMGGNLSLIGAPGNLIAQGVLEQGAGLKFGFFEYAKIGLPILVVGILYFVFIGYRFLPATQNLSIHDSIYSDEKIDYQRIPVWKQRLSLLILIGTLLAMVLEEVIGVRFYLSACIGAILLVLTGVMSEKEAYKAIDSQVIFLFGGTLALATALKNSGAGLAIANTIIGFLGENPSPFILLATIFLISCILTNFMSNTATTALLAPICLSIANQLGADPRSVLMATVIGASCAYATPIGMPANTMILSVGGYKFTDYVKAGLPLIIVSTIVSLILLPIFYPFYP